MDDLVEWLRVQLDDDERVARLHEDHSGVWVCPECGGGMTTAQRLDDHLFAYHGKRRWGPARVLREVEAKRQIIEWVLEQQVPHSTIGDDFWYPVAVLATAYSDRPGYQEEWRP